jgi:spoIIIJ-associated protein
MTEPAEGAPAEASEVEGVGETVGEAKWSALRELERRFPGLDKASVRFAVVSEGERGLLGVGYTPAKVLARLTKPPGTTQASEEPGTPSARLRELLEKVCTAVGAPCAIRITEDESALFATLSGPELGLVIGKRGHTIDAIQYLANAIVWRGHEDERKDVVVDAAGYRERRRSSLENLADRAASEALMTHSAVALEPMTAVERKIVHLHLGERGDVITSSEGTEPNRHVVVGPAG